MIDFIGKRRFYALISFALLIPSLIALGLWQFEPGLDFAGGLETEVRFVQDVGQDDIEAAVESAELPEGSEVAVSDEGEGIFRIEVIAPEAPAGDAVGEEAGDSAEEAAGDAAVEGEEAAESPPDPALEADAALGSALNSTFGNVAVTDSAVDGNRVVRAVWFPYDAVQDEVRAALETAAFGGARLQETAAGDFRIRVEVDDDDDVELIRTRINDALRAEVSPIVVLQSSSVSAVLSVEIARDAGIALACAALAILVYISLAFRRLPNPVLYGGAAIIALVHDVAIVAGAFAIAGRFGGLEVNAMFVTALLAIIGYSVNDTIVVFDRIRENLLLDPREDFKRVVNAAITQTLGRSLNTSMTLLLAVLALLLIGGVTVRPFLIVLLIGTVAGTYSSIAVASQIVVLWQDGTLPRLLRRNRARSEIRRVPRRA